MVVTVQHDPRCNWICFHAPPWPKVDYRHDLLKLGLGSLATFFAGPENPDTQLETDKPLRPHSLAFIDIHAFDLASSSSTSSSLAATPRDPIPSNHVHPLPLYAVAARVHAQLSLVNAISTGKAASAVEGISPPWPGFFANANAHETLVVAMLRRQGQMDGCRVVKVSRLSSHCSFPASITVVSVLFLPVPPAFPICSPRPSFSPSLFLLPSWLVCNCLSSSNNIPPSLIDLPAPPPPS